LGKKEKRIKELEKLTQEKDFWKNQKKAVKVNEELAELNEEMDFWGNIEKELDEMLEMSEMSEMNDKIKLLEEKIKKAEIKALFSGQYDRKDVILSVHSGAGGVEAQDWAEMLLRMYTRYAENHNFKVKTLDISQGQEAGIKNATIEISGSYAYGYLKGENGVHRLVRLSPFNADNLRHTSFALIEVLPEISEDIKKEIEIKPEDLKMDTFRSSGPGGQNVNMRSTAVRLTHLPTKIVATCQSERSQAQNREKAEKLLYTKLYQQKLKQEKQIKAALRESLPSVEWGNQIRSYVLHPYKMVKDHRTGIESNDPEEILDGNLDEFIDAEIRNL
jgi:peptide chain release factor 2